MKIHSKVFTFLLLFVFTYGHSQTLDSRGASVPFTTYEAEDANTNATKLNFGTNYYTAESESSGRRAVKLQSTNQYVEFTLTKPANGFVFRYSMPDASGGGGITSSLGFYIDNAKQQNLQLTSKHMWIYGGYSYNNNPSSGNPHYFYDDVSILLDKTYPAGTKIKLQKNSDNTAAYYIVDLMEAEEVPAQIQKPANSVSITDYGAVANNSSKDNTQALRSAISAAASSGKEVWIPAGTFYFNQSSAVEIANSGVKIRGAGMWYTILNGGSAKFLVKANDVQLSDFSIRGRTTIRVNGGEETAIESDFHTQNMQNLSIKNIWIEHTCVGIWIHNMTNLQISGCRVHNTYADGIHLRRGTNNSIVEHNHLRNTGDDGIAMWSTERANFNNKIRFNTVGMPSLASGIAVYGGYGNEITDNIIHDIVFAGAGIDVSMQHSPIAFSGITTIARNTLLRTGSLGDWGVKRGGLWIDAAEPIPGKILVSDNDIYNSILHGVSFSDSKRMTEVEMKNNVINGAGEWGIFVAGDCEGNLYTCSNTFANCKSGNIRNESQNNRFVITERSNCGGGVIIEDKVTVRFRAPSNWGQVSAYIWGSRELEGGWPGKSLVKDSEGYYVYEFDKTGYTDVSQINIIFNNGGQGEQTISVQTLTDICLELGSLESTDEYGQKHFNVKTIECDVATIHEVSKFDECKFYPNPTSDYIYCDSTDEIGNIILYNSQGSMVRNIKSQFEMIDLSGLSVGVYYVIIKMKTGDYQTQTILKH